MIICIFFKISLFLFSFGFYILIIFMSFQYVFLSFIEIKYIFSIWIDRMLKFLFIYYDKIYIFFHSLNEKRLFDLNFFLL